MIYQSLMTAPELMTLEEMMEFLNISRSNAYKMLTSGEIKGVKFGRMWRIPRASIEDYVNKQLAM